MEQGQQTQIRMNLLDKAISYVNPKWAYERLHWRVAERGAYTGGDVRPNSKGWIPVNAKAEQLNQPQRDFIRARTRDKERNSDMVCAIIGAFERNVIGTGFRVQGAMEDEAQNNRFEKIFSEWCRPENCDITGAQAFWEMEKMIIRRTLVDGGIFFIKTFNGNPKYPFQLQAREVDDLDNSLIRYGTNTVVNGVEVNQYQRPVAYHLKVFSADGWFTGKSERIPADKVIALWRKTMPSQVREISQLVSTISRINDIEDYTETVSFKEKILATLAAFIKRTLPSMGGGDTPGRGLSRTIQTKNDEYDEKTGYKRKRLRAGMLMELQPGDDVSAIIPNGQAQNAKEHIATMLRLSAAGQGLGYENASRDMGNVNYSSARQSLLEDQRTFKDWQQWIIDHFLNQVYEEVIASAVLAGTLKIKSFWKEKEKYLCYRWIKPGWSWIDPVKEVTANRIAIETGQDSLYNVCARAGYDMREVLETQARTLAYIKELEEKYGISMQGEGVKKVAEQKETAADNDTAEDGETAGDTETGNGDQSGSNQ